LFGGVRTDIGTQLVTQPGGDVRRGGVLLNVPAALEADAAFTPEEAERIRKEKIAAELAKAESTANITAGGAAARAKANREAKAKADAAEAAGGDKYDRYVFTPEQVNGPVRQAIVDLYSQGTEKGGDYVKVDEGVIKKIIDTQQTLIATGLSTRSSSLTDALAALGYVNSEDKKNRYDTQVAVTDRPGAGTGDDVVRTLTPKKGADIDPSVLIPGDPALETRGGLIEIPLESARDMLPQIRDQAELGTMFKLGNRIYEKVQMQDGSFALKAVR
jgi:hypothetical protein